MSASLKNRGTDSNDDGVDYSDPSLNGGRTHATNQPRSHAHYVVNYGVIILIALIVLVLFLTA